MSIREFYSDIKRNKKGTELGQLYKKPKSEVKGQMPISQVFKKNIYYQADLLYMPEDKKYKYILVCVDMYDGAIDAEPLKQRDNISVIKAFKEIFKRKYLDYPLTIMLDQGSEFKGDTKTFFEANGTNVKYALTGRHRQLANVERANQRIQSILFKRMASQELLTGEPSIEWADDLPELVKVFNEHKKKPLVKEIYPDPIADKYSGNLLKIGQKVRIKLDFPINNTDNKRLNGTFRTSDIRWTPQTYEITEVLLKPGQVPLYLTDKNDNVARTKNQLQPVSKKLIEPDAKYIRGEPEHYIISKILDKRIVNRKTEYLVKWKGFTLNQATWISAKELDRTKDLKQMKRDFNEEN
jgi:hypothetical protein